MTRYMNAEEAAITDVKVAGPYLFFRKRGARREPGQPLRAEGGGR